MQLGYAVSRRMLLLLILITSEVMHTHRKVPLSLASERERDDNH